MGMIYLSTNRCENSFLDICDALITKVKLKSECFKLLITSTILPSLFHFFLDEKLYRINQIYKDEILLPITTR